MSIRFSIKNTAPKAVKEGNVYVRYSGVIEPFNRHSERACKKVGVLPNGEPKLVFTTGLNEKDVTHYFWYNDEEKKVVRDTIQELRPIISEFYGGDNVIEESNTFFWKDERNVARLSLKNESIDVFYDTKNASHALLYLSIISGAFIDLVAPNKEYAERNAIPHYLALETDVDYEDEDDIRRSDAHIALGDLRKNHGKEALFILYWCLHYDTKTFAAPSNATIERHLITDHISFIDNKIQLKKKKNQPKLFVEYYEKWLGQQTRPLLYAEAYVKAGDYYSYISQREKKYVTADGTVLGNTVDEAVKNLTSKPKFAQDFEKLRDFVEAKWKE